MASRASSGTDDARFFGSIGPATRALSAFGTSALVPLLLIAIIVGNPLAIIGCVVAILLLVWWTMRALRVGYRLDGSVLTSSHASRRAPAQEIDLREVRRTGRQRRGRLALQMKDDAPGRTADESVVHLDLTKLSLDSMVRLRSVMAAEFGIDCATWGATGYERARRDREPDSGASPALD
ncbi:MAG: hypothetical protein ABJH68_14545 [Ilumatobacter sp.]|uniref:hypothetical protein n=1 Tax=Ilumatobacter sp. TaxID=1967498 RepID=UPI003297586B